MKLRNRTAHIKPATRNAMLDQLAAIADGIISDRETLLDDRRFVSGRVCCEISAAIDDLRRTPTNPWWLRLQWWRK